MPFFKCSCGLEHECDFLKEVKILNCPMCFVNACHNNKITDSKWILHHLNKYKDKELVNKAIMLHVALKL